MEGQTPRAQDEEKVENAEEEEAEEEEEEEQCWNSTVGLGDGIEV